MSELSRRRRRPPKRSLASYKIYFFIGIFFFMLIFGFKIADVLFSPFKTVVDDDDSQAQAGQLKENLYIMLMGTDEREDEPSRSDTLMVAALDLNEKKVQILSIPRDTRVKIPGRGHQKINHAHAYGGVELIQETVEDFLDIKIDNYIETNFQGFVNFIDILGGITIDVEKRMYYPDEGINLKPGLQKLDGHDALAYVRFRSDGMGDIGRVERQQKFLTVLSDHVISMGTIPKIPAILKEVKNQIKTDLSTKELIYLATKLSAINKESIETNMVPGYPQNINGISYWIANQTKLDKILEDMQ